MFNQRVIEEFRANKGKVGGPFEGGDLLLLTTTGARSGKEHTVPLGYVRDGDLLLVIASAGGAPQHPAWYHNLLAQPAVRVEIGTEEFEAVAVPAEGEQRDRLFEHVVEVEPGYGDYQAGTSRILPVVVLKRAEVSWLSGFAEKLLEVHDWLRSQLVHLRTEAEGHFAAPTANVSLGLQLRQHCLEFCHALEFHHTAEDANLFPVLADQHPHLAEVFARLSAEHRTVARLQGELLALLADIGTADPQRFLAELDRLSEELRAHLDYEEERIIPLLN